LNNPWGYRLKEESQPGKEKVMKRFFGFLGLVVVLAVPSVSFAAEQIGVYVTPKIIYGITVMDGVKTDWAGDGPNDTTNIGDKTKGTVGGGIAVGYDFNRKFHIPVRTELEYAAFAQVDAKKSTPIVDSGTAGEWSAKQTFQIQTLFANAYYDFRNSTDFTPYLGAGLGMSFINAKANNNAVDNSGVNQHHSSPGSNTTTSFAWNVGAGASYDFTENVALDLGYRFAGLGSAKTKMAMDSDGEPWVRGKTDNIYMHQIIGGLRFTF
jgi:opacity protein-like surface antigen